jgi:eukaryotic-like serine/threonine-protein kinase
VSTWAIPSYAEWAVPGYTEERLLGHGVSGRVVEAVNDVTGQRVAIKYLNANLARDSEFLAEYRSVAERLTSLNAPHAASVFDYAEQPGESAAVVTELIDGVSLRKMLSRRGPLSPKAALVVLKDSLLGLAAAHSRRVAHRDVKPDNVLIDARGWCTLTDFGIAVQTDKQVPAPGTPEYMAPELWNGAPSLPASDVYAATVVLCESLTGKPPFSGRAARLRQQHESEPVPLDQYDPPLRDLIGWGLAKYSDRRPPSAWAFAGELDARAAQAYGPDWEEEGRRELGARAEEVLAAVGDDGGAGGGSSARASRIARRKMLTFVSVAGVVLIVILGAGATLLAKKSGGSTIQLSPVSATEVSAQISGTPPVLVSKCKTPSTFTFTGAITDLQPGPISYQWQYSTGKLGPVQTMRFTTPGEQAVTSGAVSTTTAGDGWAQLNLLLNPGTKASNRVDYSLLCSSANSDITMSAKIAPASLSEASCAAPHPTLTATGTITAKNAGLVTFYWQMSNGTKTTPVQLVFTKPGTQAVNPLTFQTWVPSSGNVVLVVTKPAVTASRPVVFNVTCPKPNYGLPAPTATKPTTAKPTTAKPTTAAPTTAAPTTAAPTTAAPTTAPPPPPTTAPAPPPTTAPPTTAPPTTAPPTTGPTG